MRLFLIALLMIATPAFAESQTYDSMGTYENDAEQAVEEQAQEQDAQDGKIVPDHVEVSLVPQGDSHKTVGMRFSVPDVVNGCWAISPLKYDTAQQDPFYYDIVIHDYTRKEGPCSAGNRMAMATVPLEKKLIEDGKMKILRLSIGTTIDRYNVAYKDGIVTITPESQIKFKAAGDLIYNFERSGEKTGALIGLIIPVAPANTDTTQAIADFAEMNGLTPAPESATSSLPLKNGGSQIHYYYDSRHAMAGRVTSEFAQVGGTTIPMTYDVQDGRGQEFVPAPVYAKKIE